MNHVIVASIPQQKWSLTSKGVHGLGHLTPVASLEGGTAWMFTKSGINHTNFYINRTKGKTETANFVCMHML